MNMDDDITPPTQQKAKDEERWAAVDQYIGLHLLPDDPVMDAVMAANTGAELPSIDVAPNQGKLLYLLALSKGARRILEVGTLGGYSTIWLARALPDDGRLVTLELEPRHAEVARANVDRADIGGKVEIHVGPAAESLQRLAEEGAAPFDMVFIDADKKGYAKYLEWSLKLSQPGTLIVADNVVREGAVIDDASTDEMVLGVRAMFERMAKEPRLSATAIQTVGSKGWDGFVMAVVLK